MIILHPNFAKILTCPCSQDVITSRSSYLRRLLSESGDVAIALPAGLTFDAFAQAIATCYGSGEATAALSPASLAAAWAAAGWLELEPGAGPRGDPYGLAHATEDYFFQEVATDHGRAAGVLRCCAAFLGGEAAGPAADLLVRCLEVLAASDSGSGRWLDDVAALPVEEFLVAVEAMRARFAHDHDLMYTVVDHYLEVRTQHEFASGCAWFNRCPGYWFSPDRNHISSIVTGYFLFLMKLEGPRPLQVMVISSYHIDSLDNAFRAFCLGVQ